MNNLPSVFLSFSSQDTDAKNDLLRYLNSILGEKMSFISDDSLQPRESFHILEEIAYRAEIILILLSKNYLNSNWSDPDFIIKLSNSGKRAIPIILDYCDWKGTPYDSLLAFPKNGRPISDFPDKIEAYKEISTALLSALELLTNSRAKEIIELEKISQTGVLKLSGMSLQYIPNELLEMGWLRTLNLSQNLIGKIENLDHLVKLETLNLQKNRIVEMENLHQLKEIKELNLSKNQIPKIKDIASLHNLVRLELRGNLLESIQEIEDNLELEVLGVSENRLTDISGVQALKKLKILYAGHNQIREIKELTGLKQLRRVILTNNQLQSIKPLLGQIQAGLNVSYAFSFDENEEGIFVKDNPSISEPSVEVISSGRTAVLKYFADADRYGVQKLEIVKMVLVGNSRVGKTNFSEFLRNGEINNTSTSTHLLDIQGWDAPFLVSENKTLTKINIFDFGGQDYYHDSHRMYYSHDTAYILFWETATNQYSEEKDVHPKSGDAIYYENFPLEYWLESINYNIEGKSLPSYKNDMGQLVERSVGKSVPVLIIQNKIDLTESKIDQKTLCQKYPNVWGFLNLSLNTKKRTSILNEVLSEYFYALDLSGRKLVNFEIDIVKHYMKSDEPLQIISLHEFLNQCRTIINDGGIEFNKDNAVIIAQILNNIGMILFEKTGEADGIIYTNIRQLNQVVKEVMEVARAGNDKGIFSLDQIQMIPNCEVVIELLLRNNSIIRINENEFLAPQFLPTSPDPSIQFFLNSFSHTQLRFVYKAFFHKTLLLNLFAKYLQGEKIDTSSGVKRFPFWRNGIIIKKGDGISSPLEMVLVEFRKESSLGIVNIRTMKPFSKIGLEREIELTLDQLNRGWTVEKQASADSICFFEVESLQKEAEAKQYSFTHLPSFSNTDLAQLEKWKSITSTKSTSGFPRKNFSVNDLKHIVDFTTLPKKLFISYSSKNSTFIRRFVTHLEVLKSNGLIDPWYDRMIESGTRWDDTIREEMRRSDLVIFLLSPDFLATEYVMKDEIPLAIELFGKSKKFFFVQLLPCSWDKTILNQFQQTDNAFETNKEIISIDTPDNDSKWKLVLDELEVKLKSL